MGKKSSYPSFSGGSINLNGNRLASVSKNGNDVVANYNMSGTEKGLFDFAQNSLLQSLPQVNVFSDETQKNINSQVDAFKNRGLQTINDTYKPIINNLKNDVANRFGNLNNSVFMDNLNSIEKNRAYALSDLAQDVETQRNNLYNNELNNRYTYLNLLNDLQNQINNNIFKYIAAAQSNASLGNSYNNSAYNSSNKDNNNLSLTQLLTLFK